jgi:hypothetical protein
MPSEEVGCGVIVEVGVGIAGEPVLVGLVRDGVDDGVSAEIEEVGNGWVPQAETRNEANTRDASQIKRVKFGGVFLLCAVR